MTGTYLHHDILLCFLFLEDEPFAIKQGNGLINPFPLSLLRYIPSLSRSLSHLPFCFRLQFIRFFPPWKFVCPFFSSHQISSTGLTNLHPLPLALPHKSRSTQHRIVGHNEPIFFIPPHKGAYMTCSATPSYILLFPNPTRPPPSKQTDARHQI